MAFEPAPISLTKKALTIAEMSALGEWVRIRGAMHVALEAGCAPNTLRRAIDGHPMTFRVRSQLIGACRERGFLP